MGIAGNLTTLVSGLNRASDILVAQENKQTQHMNNPCTVKKCTAGALCLLNSSTTRSCSCSMLMNPVVTDAGLQCQPLDGDSACPLDCHSGKCVIRNGSPVCECPILYEGDLCERYRCSGYCRNKGFCYSDLTGIIFFVIQTNHETLI